MATEQQLSIYSQTAQAAYATNLLPNNDNTLAYKNTANMSQSQAAQFDATWNVLQQSTPTLNGFSAVLLQNTLTGEKVLSIAGTDSLPDWWTDLVDIMTKGSVLQMRQYGSLEGFYQQLVSTGKLTVTEQVVVTGHSSGGFLAQAFTARHSNVVSAAYTYNAPGFGGALAQLLV
jgi:pimeloyl-ACP methyl ester carboxylesterase